MNYQNPLLLWILYIYNSQCMGDIFHPKQYQITAKKCTFITDKADNFPEETSI